MCCGDDRSCVRDRHGTEWWKSSTGAARSASCDGAVHGRCAVETLEETNNSQRSKYSPVHTGDVPRACRSSGSRVRTGNKPTRSRFMAMISSWFLKNHGAIMIFVLGLLLCGFENHGPLFSKIMAMIFPWFLMIFDFRVRTVKSRPWACFSVLYHHGARILHSIALASVSCDICLLLHTTDGVARCFLRSVAQECVKASIVAVETNKGSWADGRTATITLETSGRTKNKRRKEPIYKRRKGPKTRGGKEQQQEQRTKNKTRTGPKTGGGKNQYGRGGAISAENMSRKRPKTRGGKGQINIQEEERTKDEEERTTNKWRKGPKQEDDMTQNKRRAFRFFGVLFLQIVKTKGASSNIHE